MKDSHMHFRVAEAERDTFYRRCARNKVTPAEVMRRFMRAYSVEVITETDLVIKKRK